MKIKQKRQVNLPQLIEWAWENGMSGSYTSVSNKEVQVVIDDVGVDTTFGDIYPNSNTRFEIEEEVEIDEETKLNRLIIVNDKNAYNSYDNFSIKDRLNSLRHAYNGTKFIYLQNEDGSIGELIWKDGEMVE